MESFFCMVTINMWLIIAILSFRQIHGVSGVEGTIRIVRGKTAFMIEILLKIPLVYFIINFEYLFYFQNVFYSLPHPLIYFCTKIFPESKGVVVPLTPSSSNLSVWNNNLQNTWAEPTWSIFDVTLIPLIWSKSASST